MNKNQFIILSAMSEEQFQQHVLDLAKGLGWLPYHTRRSKGSNPGYPDLMLARPPRIVYAELKIEGVKLARALTKHQRLWIETLKQCPGVETFVWQPHDMDEIEETLGLNEYVARALFGNMPIIDSDVVDVIERGIAKGFARTIKRRAS